MCTGGDEVETGGRKGGRGGREGGRDGRRTKVRKVQRKEESNITTDMGGGKERKERIEEG